MAIRYSGDAEIRLGYDPHGRVYRGTVVDPYLRFRGSVATSTHKPTTPEAYDEAARRLVEHAERWAQRRKRAFMVERTKAGRAVVRRVFQAPCPLEDL